jgi:uncharacterized SAM-binding protein YcdF (DUF218 family)
MASRVVRTTVYCLAFIGFLFVFVTFTPVLSFWIRWLTGTRWEAPKGDVLVVLGAEGPNGGMIGYSTYWRSRYAVAAWKEARFRKVIVTGDEGTTQSMVDYMTSQGVPLNSIVKEANSYSTRDNAMHTSELLTDKKMRVALLSSDIHMLRAYKCFRKAGVDPICIPAPDTVKRYNSMAMRWPVFGEVSLETLKLLGYWLRGDV